MSQVVESFEIINELGLHARAAYKLAKVAQSYDCRVELRRDGQAANAESVMGVLLLCGSKGSVLEVLADGKDAQACVDAIGKLIGNRFGEPS